MLRKSAIQRLEVYVSPSQGNGSRHENDLSRAPWIRSFPRRCRPYRSLLAVPPYAALSAAHRHVDSRVPEPPPPRHGVGVPCQRPAGLDPACLGLGLFKPQPFQRCLSASIRGIPIGFPATCHDRESARNWHEIDSLTFSRALQLEYESVATARRVWLPGTEWPRSRNTRADAV